MAVSRTCPVCEAKIPVDAPEGLCPHCLMGLATGSPAQTELISAKATTAGTGPQGMMTRSMKATTADDLPFLKRLWNDGRVMKAVGFPDGLGMTDESMTKWYERGSAKPHFRHFIVLDERGEPCGEVCHSIGFGKGRSGLDIKLLPEAQGRGLAARALMAVIDDAFRSEPETQLVWVEPSPTNAPARRLYTRCGLKEEPRPPDMPNQDWPFWALHRKDWEARSSATATDAMQY